MQRNYIPCPSCGDSIHIRDLTIRKVCQHPVCISCDKKEVCRVCLQRNMTPTMLQRQKRDQMYKGNMEKLHQLPASSMVQEMHLRPVHQYEYEAPERGYKPPTMFHQPHVMPPWKTPPFLGHPPFVPPGLNTMPGQEPQMPHYGRGMPPHMYANSLYRYHSSPLPQLPQHPKQSPVEGDEEVSNRKVKIGNLPYSTTSDQLSTIFSLCGSIEEALVFPYFDFKDEAQNYGLITFRDEEAAKLALIHHNKVFRGHVITVTSNKDATYPIFVSNFPAGNDENSVLSFFESYGKVKSIRKQKERQFFVNFAEDEARRNAMASNGHLIMKLSLKEPPKKYGTIATILKGEGFPIFVGDVPARLVSKRLFEELCELFEPFTTEQVKFNMEESSVNWKLAFATDNMRNQLLRFNNCRPDQWDVNLQLSFIDPKALALIPDSSEDEEEEENDSEEDDSSEEELFPPESHNRIRVTSQQTLKPPMFAIRVSGFSATIKNQALENYFGDAGTILECRVEIPRTSQPFAKIVYTTEEGMNKAISWSPCLIGYPTQTLTIQKWIGE